jgi:hypothetical protein
MVKPRNIAASEATLTVLTLVAVAGYASPAEAAGTTLTVNAGTAIRPVTRVAAGGLYALAEGGRPGHGASTCWRQLCSGSKPSTRRARSKLCKVSNVPTSRVSGVLGNVVASSCADGVVMTVSAAAMR